MLRYALGVSLLLGLATVPHAQDAPKADFFVSPNGSARGDGSAEHPWYLKTAVRHPGSRRPGDIFWLTRGMPGGALTITLTLTTDKLINTLSFERSR